MIRLAPPTYQIQLEPGALRLPLTTLNARLLAIGYRIYAQRHRLVAVRVH